MDTSGSKRPPDGALASAAKKQKKDPLSPCTPRNKFIKVDPFGEPPPLARMERKPLHNTGSPLDFSDRFSVGFSSGFSSELPPFDFARTLFFELPSGGSGNYCAN